MLPFRNFMILVIFVPLASAHIDCSGEDTCFGEPIDCDPDTQCKTLFQFDSVGNLHLYLRNFSDTGGYAAFAVNKHLDNLFEYLICLPHQGKRLRAIAELGGLVEVVERNLSGVVERIGSNDFRCMFTIFELPTKFEQEQVFFVSRGVFDDVFVILDGDELFNLIPSTSDESENSDIFLTTHPVASLSRRGTAEDVFTSDDKESVSNAIKKLPEVSETKDDNVLEKLANSRRRLRSRSIRKRRPIHYEDDDRDMGYDDEYEMKPHLRSRKNKSRSRHQRDDPDIDEMEVEEVEEEAEEVEEEEGGEEEEERKRPKKGKKNNRRRRYRGYAEENDEPRKRNSGGKKNMKEVDEEDEYEENESNEEDEIYDDAENSGNKLYNQFHIMVLVVIWADMMIFNE